MPAKRIQKPAAQQKKMKPTGFFQQCADIAVVINLILPILISIFLVITLFYTVAVKKSYTLVYPILGALFVFAIVIGLTLLLYRYFPSALCVLFLINLVMSFFTIVFVQQDEKKQ